MEIKSRLSLSRGVSSPAEGEEKKASFVEVDEEWDKGKEEKKEAAERGREGFMPRLTLLLTVAYYGNFLKLRVGENAGNNANRKRIIIGL